MAAQRVRDNPYTCGRAKEDVTVERGEVSERTLKWEYEPHEARRDRCEADVGLSNDNVYGSIRERK